MAKTDILLESKQIKLIGEAATMSVDGGQTTLKLDAKHGNLTLGGGRADGDLILKDKAGNARVHVDGGGGPKEKRARVWIDAKSASVEVGGDEMAGGLTIRGIKGHKFIHAGCDPERTPEDVRVHLDGPRGHIKLGGNGSKGVLHIKDHHGNPTIAFGAFGSLANEKTTVAIDGLLGQLTLGGERIDGDLILRDADRNRTIHLSGGKDGHTRPKADVAIAMEGHTGTIRCNKLLVKSGNKITDLLERIEQLEREVAALKRGGR